jgi:hypothetical protein
MLDDETLVLRAAQDTDADPPRVDRVLQASARCRAARTRTPCVIGMLAFCDFPTSSENLAEWLPPLPALLQGKLEDEVTQRWLKESCPGSVFQAMTRRRKVAEFRVVTPLPYASLHVASRNAGASVRGAGEPTVAEKGNREDWLLSRQTSGTESSNSVRSTIQSLSFRTSRRIACA